MWQYFYKYIEIFYTSFWESLHYFDLNTYELIVKAKNALLGINTYDFFFLPTLL